MSHFFAWLGSSVGKKQVVGLTGLGISLFAFLHMAGNLMMFISPELYNFYGHQTTHNPIFPALELLLLAAFIFHLVLACQLWLRNREARPVGNSVPASGPKKANFGSRSMILTGLLLFVFLVLHIKTFKYGPVYMVTYNGLEVRDLYRLLVEKFQDPTYVAWYIFSLVVLGVHMSHGIGSALQSMGISGVRNPTARKISIALAAIIAGGFIAQPIWIMCCGGAQ